MNEAYLKQLSQAMDVAFGNQSSKLTHADMQVDAGTCKTSQDVKGKFMANRAREGKSKHEDNLKTSKGLRDRGMEIVSPSVQMHGKQRGSFMTSHTQGPWCFGVNPGPIIYGPKGKQIVDMRYEITTQEENKANARLIAAAPELLVDNAALRGIILRHVKAKELSEHEKAAFNKAAHNYAAIARATSKQE